MIEAVSSSLLARSQSSASMASAAHRIPMPRPPSSAGISPRLDQPWSPRLEPASMKPSAANHSFLPLCQLLPLNPHKSLCLLLLHLPLHHLLQPQPQPPPHLQAQLPLHLLAGGTHLADTVPGSGSLLVPLACADHCQRGGELNVLNALTSNRTLLASLTLVGRGAIIIQRE